MLKEEDKPTIALTSENFPDFMNFGFQTLVSDKVKAIFEKEAIRGYHLAETNIISAEQLTEGIIKKLRDDEYTSSQIKKFAISPPNYYRLYVNGKAELHEQSDLVLIEECTSCGFTQYRTKGKTYGDPHPPNYICLESWNGYDLFQVKKEIAIISLLNPTPSQDICIIYRSDRYMGFAARAFIDTLNAYIQKAIDHAGM